MEKNFGPDQLNVTYGLTATANADVALKRYAEGEPFAKRSLAIRQKALGPDHTDVASVLKTLAQINLGTNRVSRGRFLAQGRAGRDPGTQERGCQHARLRPR